MTWLTVLFWLSAACVFYTYVAYPLILAVAVRLRPAAADRPAGRSRRSQSRSCWPRTTRNLASARGVRELVRLVAARPAGGEVIVVSDGSTDRTAEVAQAAATEAGVETGGRVPVRVIVQPTNLGKAAALNAGLPRPATPCSCLPTPGRPGRPTRSTGSRRTFADPSVGAVSGDLVVESPPGVMAGFGLYWRFEKWLRRTESRFRFDGQRHRIDLRRAARALPTDSRSGRSSTTSTGRWRSRWAGHRVVHDERARAFDRLPSRVRDEFRRKVRTLCGNFQLIARLPSALLPWRNRALVAVCLAPAPAPAGALGLDRFGRLGGDPQGTGLPDRFVGSGGVLSARRGRDQQGHRNAVLPRRGCRVTPDSQHRRLDRLLGLDFRSSGSVLGQACLWNSPSDPRGPRGGSGWS